MFNGFVFFWIYDEFMSNYWVRPYLIDPRWDDGCELSIVF
jgi:hypothetical protein